MGLQRLAAAYDEVGIVRGFGIVLFSDSLREFCVFFVFLILLLLLLLLLLYLKIEAVNQISVKPPYRVCLPCLFVVLVNTSLPVLLGA